ncbi:MAG: acyl-CoA dehydrogenase family protein [Bacteriovoracia bacterium]
MDFFQTPPVFGNPYLDDNIFKKYLLRILPESFYSEISEDLKRMADRVTREMEPLAQRAELHPPVHVPYDPWGRRIDEIRVSKEWERLHEIAAEEGIVATGHERKFGEFSRVYQFSKLYLYHPSSAIYSCPLAMTDGAARLIELFGTEDMKKRAYRFLTSRDPKTFWTSGQWMTERTGGSDVSGTSTIAKKEGDQYRLHGVKWFTSATTSQMAMTLAKVEGDEKLSLFYLELRDEEGKLQNIQINRLKDKMGTKALPTAELTLSGTPATLVGERGKGVKTIATLFNITRLYNACCAVGYMRRGIALAVDFSKKRVAFGKPILHHGLHAEMLADLQVRFEASFLMAFHSALLLGKEETGKASEVERGTLRLLIPLVKLFTAKEGVSITSEVIESFGGAGYVEDTGLPQILRNAQVLSIWEGTTNVLSLDSLRAIRKENAADYFMKDVEQRLNKIKRPELHKFKEEVKEAMSKAIDYLRSQADEEQMNSEARVLAMNLSRIYCAGLLLEHSEWELEQNGGTRALIVAGRFIGAGLFEEFRADKSHREKTLSILS